MKNFPLGGKLYHVDRRTNIHDGTNSRLSQLCKRAQNQSRNAVCSKIHTKHMNTLTAEKAQLFNIKPDGT
jgi:hypothetical protein